MYQSIVNILLESGYHKYMTEMGPVYVYEKEEKQIVFLTYHKNQEKQPIYMKNYEDQLILIKETIFPSQDSDILCIMIVDDGELLEEQMKDNNLFSMWIQDEQTGKLYMSKDSDTKFAQLFSTIERKSIEAKKLLEEENVEEINQFESIKIYFTPGNIGIIITNFIVFLFSEYLCTDMIQAGSSEWSAILLEHEIYRLFTAMFLHFDIEHLITNMLVLFLIGSFVEHYLGTIKYIIAYLICGAAGNMLSFYFAIGEQSLILSAGASGAVYGVLGILAVLLWKTKGRLEGIQGPGLVFFVIGMIFHSYQSEGVDNWAHIGGLIMGIILGIVLKRNLDKTAEEAGD